MNEVQLLQFVVSRIEIVSVQILVLNLTVLIPMVLMLVGKEKKDV